MVELCFIPCNHLKTCPAGIAAEKLGPEMSQPIEKNGTATTHPPTRFKKEPLPGLERMQWGIGTQRDRRWFAGFTPCGPQRWKIRIENHGIVAF